MRYLRGVKRMRGMRSKEDLADLIYDILLEWEGEGIRRREMEIWVKGYLSALEDYGVFSSDDIFWVQERIDWEEIKYK